MQNAERPGPQSIPYQDIKTAVPFQGLVGLAQVEEDKMEDLISHGNEIPKKEFLKGGGPHSYPRAKSMQSVMDWMEDNIRKWMILDIEFYRTYTRPIPLNYMPTPLDIITTVCQEHG